MQKYQKFGFEKIWGGPPTLTNIIKSKKADLKHRVNTAKSSGSAYFHKFLEIKCSYLCPNDLDDSFLAQDNSEFTIFHNNVNSLCSTDVDKYCKFKSVFQNCSGLPDFFSLF